MGEAWSQHPWWSMEGTGEVEQMVVPPAGWSKSQARGYQTISRLGCRQILGSPQLPESSMHS